MFALKSPMIFSCVPIRRRISRTIRGYYKLDKTNSQPLEKVENTRMFHILAFIKDGDMGIYSVTEQMKRVFLRITSSPLETLRMLSDTRPSSKPRWIWPPSFSSHRCMKLNTCVMLGTTSVSSWMRVSSWPHPPRLYILQTGNVVRLSWMVAGQCERRIGESRLS